jgi:hypothetical protein
MNSKHLVSRFAAVVTLCLALGSQTASASGLKCDADVDGDIDNKDLALIAAARNTPASGPDDPRDADSDGLITVTDGRICALRCTLPDCGEPAGNRAPSADAGSDQLVFTGSMVMLDGTGSTDPDGDPLTFRWRFLERPAGSTAALSDPAAARPTFTADFAGRYVAELIVNDGALDSDPDTVVVNTEDRNTDPVANAGPDQPGAFVGIEVTLDGSGSTDVDGDALVFSWAFVSRPAGSTAALVDAGTVGPRFTPDRRGVFVVRLTVNDGRGGTATDDVAVSTESTDRPPVAVAGPDQSVEPGQEVCLDGSASFDPDLDPISAYAWSFTTRPAGSSAVLAGAATATPCFTADRRGDFVVQLIVTANAVASVPDTVVVTTNNVRPVADAGPDQTVTIDDVVSLDGTGSSDANGDALGFNWTFVSRPAGSSATLAGALTPFASFAADVAGPFVVQLIVNDGLLDSLPDTTLITVNALENNPPSAVNDSATTPEGVSVLIDVLGNDSDPDGDPLTITEVSDPAGGSTAIEANKIRFTPDAGFSGETSFTYVISDGRGGTSSATVTVTVTAGNAAPVASAGPDQSVYLGDAIVLDGSGSSDPDGDPITYLWTVQSAPPGAAVGFTPSTTVASPAVTVSTAGLYVLRLVVNDGSLDSAPDDVAITVAALPALSIDNVSVLEGDAGTTDAVFTVTLSSAMDRVVTVDYATVSGTATAGSDFVATSGTLTFPAGSTAAQTITVLVNGDTDVEPNETFFVDLSSPVNATIASGRGTGTILNDDSATLTLLPANQSLLVGATGSLTVSLPAPAGSGGVVVTLASNDTNVATVPASVTVAEGALSAVFDVTAGATAGTAQITATAAGYTAANANVTVSLRGLSIAVGSPLVGVGRTVGGTVTLAAAAPAAGVTVNLSSGAPGTATVAPASVFIAAGGTAAAFTVTGVALGVADIEATATGYTPATVTVSVSNQVVNIGVVPTVGPGQTASLPISLSSPAVGDVVISVSTADPTIATISPATVTIPNGQVLPPVNPQVTGVALGATTVTATAAGYAPETRAVTVALSLAFQTLPATIEIPVSGTQNVALNLSAPANVGGFTANLASDNTGVATVPATVTFPAGQTQVQVPVTGVGAGGTTIRASAAGVPEATKAVTVFSLGSVQFSPATVTVGRNLQQSVSVRLQNAPPSPVDLTLSVPAGSGVLLSSSATGAGAETLVIPAVADASFRSVYVQGTAIGTPTVTASAPGYAAGTLAVTVTPSGFAFYAVNDPTEVDVFAPNQQYQVWSVRLNEAGVLQAWQPTRGGATFEVPATSSNPAAGTIVTSPLVFEGNTSFVNATFDPIALGSTNVSITQPAGFTATTSASTSARAQFTVNVVGSSVQFSPATVTVGRNLQQSVSVRLQNAPPSPVDLTLSVPAGSGVLLSSSATGAGAETLVIPAVADASFRSVYVQGTAIGTPTVTASAPGYAAGTLAVTVTPSGFAFYAVNDPTEVDVFAPNQQYQVWSVRLNEAGVLQAWQPTRGGATFEVPATSSNPAAGTIVTSPLVFEGNTSFVNATFDPIALGSTNVSITQPAGFTATTSASTSARAQFTVNVVGSSVQFSPATVTVGRNLQQSVSVRLQNAPPSPVDLTLSVPAGSGVLLSSSATGAGAETLVIPAVADASFRSVYVQGTAIGTPTVTASAPGYAAGTLAVTVTPSGFAFYAVNDPTEVDVFAPNQQYQVWSVRLNEAGVLQAWQPTRGGATFEVPATSSNPAAGTIVTSPLVFEGNTSFVNATFDPIALGSTNVSITQPAGFTATTSASTSARAQFTVNVTSSAIQFSPSGTIRVGRNLQSSTSVRLQSAPPSPVDLTLSVPAGSGVLLTLDGTAAGAETLVIPAVADASFRTVYIQGTGIGATSIQGSAAGYVDATQAVVVAPAGFAFYAVASPTETNNGTPTSYQVWSIVLDDAGAIQTWQPTRGGATFEVPVVSSNVAAGVISNSPLVFGPNTSFANASFVPVAAGSTVVSITQPAGFTATTSANSSARTSFTVNVTAGLAFGTSAEAPSGVASSVDSPAVLSPVAATLAAAPATAAPTTTTLSKAELKRQQRIEKARQRAAQKEAKQLLKQSRRAGATTPAGVMVPGSTAGAATAPVPPAATMPGSPAAPRPPE